mmetsp:Transcript_64419/g.76273  ORF Transcript_64419/g.76273 Transcript_64419/m.76273 type:complete len:106 (+) Transcript_64419:657-974(+)
MSPSQRARRAGAGHGVEGQGPANTSRDRVCVPVAVVDGVLREEMTWAWHSSGRRINENLMRAAPKRHELDVSVVRVALRRFRTLSCGRKGSRAFGNGVWGGCGDR